MHTPSLSRRILLRAALGCWFLGTAASAWAGVVGDIQVVYNAPSTFQFNGSPVGIIDAPAFLIENTSSVTLSQIVFTVDSDKLSVAAIAAKSTVVVLPGLSTDGQSHTGFWTYLGAPRDTSDVGPNSNDVQFLLTASVGGVGVGTGIFTPAATAGPTNDGTIALMNFLGGGPNSDGPCNNCFGPKVVAEILQTVPEPATWILLGTGLTFVLTVRRGLPRRGLAA